MLRLVRCGGLFLLLVAFVVPTFAGDPVKKEGGETKPQEKDKKKAEIKEKFSYGSKFLGKVTQVDTAGTNRDFTLQVTTKVQEINQGAQQALARDQQSLLNHQREFAQAKTVQGRQQAQQRIQQTLASIAKHQSELYKVKDVNKDYKFRPAENVIFRTLYPEPQYNDKGELVTPTKEELKALKGKHQDLPGYEATAEVLRGNAQAAVYTPRTKAKDLKKTTDDDPVLTDRQEVILVIVINAAPAQAPK